MLIRLVYVQKFLSRVEICMSASLLPVLLCLDAFIKYVMQLAVICDVIARP